MTPDKERMELYRKWFKTLLVKEFLNLPIKQQTQFFILSDKFIKDCRKIHEDAKKIQEKPVHINVTEILNPDNPSENYIIVGIVQDVPPPHCMMKVRIEYPSGVKKPNVGDVLSHTVYSVDGEIWYSSKTELITGRRS
jgi:ribosome biogenesis SPOUT family RNA methylase Rps3